MRPHTAEHLIIPPPDIRISGAKLTFGSRSIFQGLDFRAKAGKFTGILGPSGVGKTTLLKLIAGLHPPQTAQICDQSGGTLTGKIAWMAQKDLLLPWLSILDNVCLGSCLRQSIQPGTREKAMILLEKVGLQSVAHQRPDTLSGGMKQRAALARTLMEDRPVILMDEPFSAVDPLTRIMLQDLAAELLQGRTVVFVTHDPLEALRLGHTVLVLNGEPATLEEILPPATQWPRPVDHPDVLKAQAEILAALAPRSKQGGLLCAP